MPTAGEAGLAKKKTNERSVKRPTKKAGSTSTAPRVKSTQVKSRNSRIPTIKKKQEKENIKPNNQQVKATCKPAPDFSKLHNRWNNKFQKGKAVSKKTNTKVSPFVLTEVKSQTTHSKISGSSDKENVQEEEEEEDFGFEIDDNALQGILNNTGIQVQQDTHPQTRNTYAGPPKSAPNTITGVSTKRTSIYYTGTKKSTTTQHQPLQTRGLASNRPVFGFQAKLGKKQVVWADQGIDDDDDEISFKPDASALESILNNKGIDDGQSVAVRHTMASTRSVPFMQNSKRQSVIENQPSKRTSIYYTGSKSSKGITSDLPRPSLVGRSHTTVLEKTTVPVSQRTAVTPSLKTYVPGSTVVGRQDEEIDNKDSKVNTFVRPLTPTNQEASSQLSKTIDTKTNVANALMTPCRGNVDTKSQPIITNSSKKQVSWSDILTPHRGMDYTKPKETILSASKEQAKPISSLKQHQLGDSSPWLTSATKPSTTLVQSPVDTNTPIALKLFSDDDTCTKEMLQKEKLELEELERQAIEELKLLEVEENRTSKGSCQGFNNVIKTSQSIDISGCEPLLSPLEVFNTPRNLNRGNLTDQWIAATPQNHMCVTIRNKTPKATSVVRHHTNEDAETNELLAPRCHTLIVASPCLSVQQANVARPAGSGFQATTCHTATTASLASRARSTVLKTAPYTPAQHVVETPVIAPLDAGQSPFGLLSSIKKSACNLGNKRPHSSSSLPSNPPFHKTLSWDDTFCSSTPGIDMVTSSFQGPPMNTFNGHPNPSGSFQNAFPASVYLSDKIPTHENPNAETPSTRIFYGNNFFDPAKKPAMSVNCSNSAEKPWTSIRGNNFYEPATKKSSTSIHDNHFYQPAEKPFATYSERGIYSGNSSNRLPLEVCRNNNLSNRETNDLPCSVSHTQLEKETGYAQSSSNTSSRPTVAGSRTGMSILENNSHYGNKSIYTNCMMNGKGTVESVYSPVVVQQQAQPWSNPNFDNDLHRLSQHFGAINVVRGNRSNLLNHVHPPCITHTYPGTDESLSLRSAVQPTSSQKRGPINMYRKVVSTMQRSVGETGAQQNCTSSHNKGVHLARPIETRNTLTEEALLDTEVALYSALGVRIKKRCTRDLSNPLAKIFDEGDSQHIVPICVCSDKIYCSVHPVPQTLFHGIEH